MITPIPLSQGEEGIRWGLKGILQSQDPLDIILLDSGRRVAVSVPNIGKLQIPAGPDGG